jgi:hypothetical protein
MKRTLAALVRGLMAIMATGDALAGPPTGLEPNPTTNSHASDNCIAYYSAVWQHNGLIVRGQDRPVEIKGPQENCNNANEQYAGE